VIAKQFRGSTGIPGDGFDFAFFRKRALTAAAGADIRSFVISAKNENTFVSAFLQDIGIILMYRCRTED
jgi:hypothetical protein